MRTKIESIEDKINKKGTSTRKALYDALQDVAAHLVIEAEGLAQASQITPVLERTLTRFTILSYECKKPPIIQDDELLLSCHEEMECSFYCPL